MAKNKILIAGSTAACRFARSYLSEYGLPLAEYPVESVGHLLLDVPSFGPSGQLRMGGAVENILKELPEDVCIYGGNLNNPALAGYKTVDFLQDEAYLAENAWLTAEAALDVALPYLTVALRNCPVLILGWGRIGKCLGQLLKAIGVHVTVTARKETDRALLGALGYGTVDTAAAADILRSFRLIYNTVPFPILSKEQTACCREDCVIIELASTDGIEHDDVIIARGLPGIHLPESSGKLIAQTFLRHYHKGEGL